MRSRLVAVALATALLAGACGSRTDDNSGGGDISNDSTTTTAAAQTDGMFGTIESPCGPGDA